MEWYREIGNSRDLRAGDSGSFGGEFRDEFEVSSETYNAGDGDF
jgi:hypothetical protein